MVQDSPPAPAPAQDKSDGDPPLLRIASVTKRFGGVVAVENLSLDIRAGEFFARRPIRAVLCSMARTSRPCRRISGRLT
jgi:hypothetical protein